MDRLRIAFPSKSLCACLLGVSLLLLSFCRVHAREEALVDFTHQVQPILDKCISCHGGVKTSGGLSLLSRQLLLASSDQEEAVVVVGDASSSHLIERVTSTDPDLQMPPDEKLDASEIKILRTWIDQGLNWPSHWAYQRPTPPQLSASAEKSLGSKQNPIDSLVGKRLREAGVAPAKKADRQTLIRRLSLDLTGLLPTTLEVQQFLLDDSPSAYSQLVDRLLASPHYGERWARHWLDEARYADSEGYEKDSPKTDAYLFRDWVVQSINEDMPFDQFTIKQIAGDLLPERTNQDLLATKFHLQTQFNLEGGVDAEEDRTKRVIDRISTVGSVWLGSTIGCCQCHNHPYDPFSQHDFYALYAFFNNADFDADFLGTVPTDADSLRLERKNTTSALNKLLEKQVHDKNLSSEVQSQLSKLRGSDNQKAFVRFLHERSQNRRTTYAFRRGNFLQPITENGPILPHTPTVLPPLKTRGTIADRLDLANWLVEPENPLVGRVAVNKIWMHLFGAPLAGSPDDFGSRGIRPDNQDLLDWLAHWYQQEAGWSRKALIRLIVHSDCYQQSSDFRPRLYPRDPKNGLLARQNRFRLEAEILRDIALQTAGLLSRKMGGPSVFPPLPAIVAQQTYAGSNKYQVSQGEDRYRRGLYTFFRRTAIDPNLSTFDCPDSSSSKSQRDQSNNAIQALALLQNEVFHESAQGFAARLLKTGFASQLSDEALIRQGYLIAVSREPNEGEIGLLVNLLQKSRVYYQQHPNEAPQLLGKHHVQNVAAQENAAWVATTRVILNLDEFVTRN